MTKFTMQVKDFKDITDKAATAASKHGSLEHLKTLFFTVLDSGVVKVLGTNIDHYAEIRSENAWETCPGEFGVAVEDVKVISKMSGIVTLEDVSTENENKIRVLNGNKKIVIPKYSDSNIHLPEVKGNEKIILTASESWFIETISNLSSFTKDDEVANEVLKCFNFNTINKRVEACDSFRIGIRNIEEQTIETESQVLLHNRCIPVLKKIMDKKSSYSVKLSSDNSYIRVEGKTFTYVSRLANCIPLNVDKMMKIEGKYSFNVERESIFSVMKYNCDLLKSIKNPVFLYKKNGELRSYVNTGRYESFDRIEAESINMEDGFMIGFDPRLLVDVFLIIDHDMPTCIVSNERSPMFIKGNEYEFLILPVNISDKRQKAKLAIEMEG